MVSLTDQGRGSTRTQLKTRMHLNGKPQANDSDRISRAQLIDLLNGDLGREYQAVIAYVVYSRAINLDSDNNTVKNYRSRVG